MNTIKQHIDSDKKELSNSMLSPQRRRHLTEELQSLERYQSRHPTRLKDPTPLELYCDENPSASECRLYEI